MKKKILFFFLFSILKLHSQTTAGYLSSTIQPWGSPTNINAMNTVYGTDWSQYNYNTVNVAALFDANRKFIWIEGSESNTSQMIPFLAANATIIENWVKAGGTLLINTATVLGFTSYDVGFGVTSQFSTEMFASAVNNSDLFFALSPYQPITAVNYQGGYVAHNIFSGAGLSNILTSTSGAAILTEKKIGSGLVRFSGLTTSWFEDYRWLPKIEILNLLYRMISKLSDQLFITVINPVTMVCGGESDAVQFTIFDDKTSPNNLIVSATSSNQTLIPDANLVLSGTGALRTLDFTSITGQSGTTTISVKITDEDANTFTQTFTVTVSDTELPVVKTKDITVQLDANGNATITADQIDNGSTDNCGIASKTLDKTNFRFDDLGENTVTLTVKDLSGNTSTKTAIVTIPLKCPADIIVNNNDLNKCGAIVNYNFEKKRGKVLVLATYLNNLAADVKQKLENTHEFDVVDLIDLSTFTPDLAVLQKYDVILVYSSYGVISMPGAGNVLAQYIDSGGGVVDAVFDNANQAITGLYNTDAYRVLIPSNFTGVPFSSLGTIDVPNHPIMKDVVTFNTGSRGFRSSSTQITPGSYVVSRYDDGAMLVIAKENVGLNFAKRVSLNFYPISSTVNSEGWDASTNGDKMIANALKWVGRSLIIKRIAGLRSGSLFPVGTTTNTFEVTDKNNIIHTCSFKVTVKDTEIPTVLTQDITVQLNALGKATITESQINDGSTDNCSIDKITLDKTTFDCTNIGANTVTLTVLDVNGNSDSKTAIVTVEDKIKPIVATKDNTVQLDALGKATITESQINDGSTDNCSIDKITLDKTTFDCSNIGANTVTLTVVDVNGNSDSKTAIVTIEDKIKPTVITKDITVQLDVLGKATITESQINDGSTDNCAIDKITLDKTTFDCTNIGANTVTLTVLDVNGNSDSKTAIVTVEDKIKPTVITKDITVQLDVLEKATITESQINDGSTDNCSIDKITLDKTSFDCSNIGANTVTLTVVDVNGNSDSKTAIVTIEDKIKPIVATKDILLQLDVLGKATITESQINDGSTDNCSIDKITLDKTTFDCSNIGANTVTLTVFDVNGNSDSKTAIVTVEDKIKPLVATKDITVQLDALGKATITESQINDGSTDNCSIDKITLDKTTFDCSNIGANTVTLTVLDVNGNSDSKTAIVTVEDKIKPIVATKDILVQLDALGKVTIIESQINDGSTDNCLIDKVTLDKTTFDCSNIGTNTVTLTVLDVNGNSDSKTAIVTVEDKIKPLVATKDITIQLDALGKATITESQINDGSTDNCSIDKITLDKTTFDCSNIGANTVTLTVVDVIGNSDSKTAIVTIEDKIKPTVITKDITIQLDALGKATIIESQINDGSSDNCSIDKITLDKTTFDCSNIGTNTVTLTVLDVNGNSDSKTAIVTVEDKVKPIVATKDITVQLDALGKSTITESQINDGSTDNCSIDKITLDKTTFDCSNIGVNTVILTVLDVNGNSDSKTAIVTVEDKVKPTVITKDITVQLDALGKATITESQINDGSTDNCSIDKITLDKTDFDCSNIGANTVTLTIIDKNGNSASGTAVIIVEDLIAPNVTPKNITVQLDATGKAEIVPALINNGSTDNCSIDKITLDKTTFDCTNIGANNVTLTVTDVNGNSASKVAVVTIEDKIAPIVVTQNITVELDTTGNLIINESQIDNGSTDNCKIATTALDKTTFDCTNIGINTITLTVTDASGNSASQTAILTILPLSIPTFFNTTQSFCVVDNASVGDIEVKETNVKWFSDANSSQPLALNTLLKSQTYYAATFKGNCYSQKVPVVINVNDTSAPTGNAVQYVCKEKETLITDLVTIEQEILWYDRASGGSPLNGFTVLEDKHKYYAAFVGAECESSQRFEVEVIFRYCDVVVHNGISANGDGVNDFFDIEGADTFKDNKLEIFNSWGSLVFETTSYGKVDNQFKGYANKGLGGGNGLLPFGTYYYVFSFTNHDNSRITKKGFLHLNP